MIRRWFLALFPHEKSVLAWGDLSRLSCDDGYVRGTKPALPGDRAKLKLPSQAERKSQVRRIA